MEARGMLKRQCFTKTQDKSLEHTVGSPFSFRAPGRYLYILLFYLCLAIPIRNVLPKRISLVAESREIQEGDIQ